MCARWGPPQAARRRPRRCEEGVWSPAKRPSCVAAPPTAYANQSPPAPASVTQHFTADLKIGANSVYVCDVADDVEERSGCGTASGRFGTLTPTPKSWSRDNHCPTSAQKDQSNIWVFLVLWCCDVFLGGATFLVAMLQRERNLGAQRRPSISTLDCANVRGQRNGQ